MATLRVDWDEAGAKPPTLVFENVSPPLAAPLCRLVFAAGAAVGTDEERLQATLGKQLAEAFNRVFGDLEVLAKGRLANSLTDLTELVVDPRRAAHTPCGVLVRAKSVGGRFVDADVAHLSAGSLLAWLRSRGTGSPWAEDFVGYLFGHGPLTDRDGSPMVSLNIPLGVAIAALVEVAGLGPAPLDQKTPQERARLALDRLGVSVELVPGEGSTIAPGNDAGRPS